MAAADAAADSSNGESIFCQFRSPEGETMGPQLEIPLGLTTRQLNGVLNELLNNDRTEPYSFYVNDDEIVGTLGKTVEEQKISSETVVSIIYKPQAAFRVTAVTRCSGTLPGHTEVGHSKSCLVFTLHDLLDWFRPEPPSGCPPSLDGLPCSAQTPTKTQTKLHQNLLSIMTQTLSPAPSHTRTRKRVQYA